MYIELCIYTLYEPLMQIFNFLVQYDLPYSHLVTFFIIILVHQAYTDREYNNIHHINDKQRKPAAIQD